MEYYPKHTNTGKEGTLKYSQRGFYIDDQQVENNRALHNDIVCFEEGRVTGIKRRTLSWIAGILHLENNKKYGFTKKNIPYYKFTPLSGKYPSFIVPTKRRDKCALYCAITFNSWTEKNKHPIGQVEQYIGEVGNIENETTALLYKNNVFPKKNKTTLKEIAPPREADVKYNSFSIDPKGCRDIDDAFSYNEVDGFIEIGIHIAHVGQYIENFNSMLFSSIYLNDKQINMLDDKLTYDTLSLGNGIPKHAMSIIFTYNENGKLIKKHIKRTVVRNKALSYQAAEEIIKRDQEHPVSKLHDLTKKILKVDEISATKLVEHFMILYNSTVAEFLYYYNKKTILRNHKRLEFIGTESLLDPDLSNYLTRLNQNAALYSISGEKPGHDNLALRLYTHATSPIRRFVDVINQINLVNFISKEELKIVENIDIVNLFNKNLRKFYNNYKKLNVIFSETTKGVQDCYITEIKNKKLKVYIPSLEIEHGFYPVSPKLFDCNEIIEKENMIVVNDMELKLYSKIKIDITCLPYETKFNKKLYIRIVDLNCLGNV